jgi:hypothetical protein
MARVKAISRACSQVDLQAVAFNVLITMQKQDSCIFCASSKRHVAVTASVRHVAGPDEHWCNRSPVRDSRIDMRDARGEGCSWTFATA